MTEKTYTPKELEEMANTLLAADGSKQDGQKKKDSAKADAAKDEKEAARDGEAKKDKGKLDDKTIASLPAASLIMANEKLRDMLSRGKKKGKLDANEVSDVLDEWTASTSTTRCVCTSRRSAGCRC